MFALFLHLFTCAHRFFVVLLVCVAIVRLDYTGPNYNKIYQNN